MSEIYLPNKQLMSAIISNSLTKIHSTNIYSFLKQNGLLDEAKNQFSKFCVEVYQQRSNKSFHKGLNFFEKGNPKFDIGDDKDPDTNLASLEADGFAHVLGENGIASFDIFVYKLFLLTVKSLNRDPVLSFTLSM